MAAIRRPPDPLRDGRFGWLVMDAWVVLAETLGLDSQPGAHTNRANGAAIMVIHNIRAGG